MAGKGLEVIFSSETENTAAQATRTFSACTHSDSLKLTNVALGKSLGYSNVTPLIIAPVWVLIKLRSQGVPVSMEERGMPGKRRSHTLDRSYSGLRRSPAPSPRERGCHATLAGCRRERERERKRERMPCNLKREKEGRTDGKGNRVLLFVVVGAQSHGGRLGMCQ